MLDDVHLRDGFCNFLVVFLDILSVLIYSVFELVDEEVIKLIKLGLEGDRVGTHRMKLPSHVFELVFQVTCKVLKISYISCQFVNLLGALDSL
jgi:hypothetical protein